MSHKIGLWYKDRIFQKNWFINGTKAGCPTKLVYGTKMGCPPKLVYGTRTGCPTKLVYDTKMGCPTKFCLWYKYRMSHKIGL